MMASRGMGAISPSKMPSGKRKARRDDTDFTEYASGGSVRLGKPSVESAVKKAAKGSKVNQAGNYTKPGMRKSLFESIKARAVQGTAAGQWSARKAQLLAKKYKEKGGGYRG
jgi:hypothetical protein